MRQFCLRPDSGGRGQWTGGNGVIREIEFTSPSHASVLTQRRVYNPYGMAGGDDGKRGINYLGRKRADGSIKWVNVGGTREVDMEAGDRLKLCTPGGGGYGEAAKVNGLHVNGRGVNGHGVKGVNGYDINGDGANGHISNVNGHGLNGNGVDGHGANGSYSPHVPRANGSLRGYESAQQASN